MSVAADLRPVAKLLAANTGARRISEVFEDFVELMAIALVNRIRMPAWDEREADYLTIAARYDGAALDRFAEAFAAVHLSMQEQPRDVLGELYMSLDLGNSSLGQFFTPWSVARLIAGMQAPEIARGLEDREFVTVYEPACGGGVMLVALIDALTEAGVDVRGRIHFTAEDLAGVSMRMTYVNLSMLDVAAVVSRTDSLTRETFTTWPTLRHVADNWSARVRA